MKNCQQMQLQQKWDKERKKLKERDDRWRKKLQDYRRDWIRGGGEIQQGQQRQGGRREYEWEKMRETKTVGENSIGCLKSKIALHILGHNNSLGF